MTTPERSLEVERARARVQSLLDEVDMHVVSSMSDVPAPGSPAERLIAAIHTRALELYRSTRTLLRAGDLAGASILARSLFEDSLRLGELAAAGDARAGLLLGWMSESVSLAERLLRAGVGEDNETFRAEREQVLTDRRRAIAEAGARLGGVGRLRRFPGAMEMIRRQGRDVDLHAYIVAHHMTHGSELAHVILGRRTFPTSLASMDEPLRDQISIWAIRSLLHAFVAASGMLSWPGRSTAESMLEMDLAAETER